MIDTAQATADDGGANGQPDADDELEPFDVTESKKELGRRLVRLRQLRGLSQREVEDLSGGVWKAVVVGSYERGDRAITAAKLAAYVRWLADCRLVVVPASHAFAQVDTLLMTEILYTMRKLMEANAGRELDASIALLSEYDDEPTDA